MLKVNCLFKKASAVPYDMTAQGGQRGISYTATFLFSDGSDQKMKFPSVEIYELYKNLEMKEGELEFELRSSQAKPSVAFVKKFTENEKE